MGIRNRLGANLDSSPSDPGPSLESRSRLVQRICREIADGTYESDRKLEIAIKNLIDDLRDPPRRSSLSAVREGRGTQGGDIGPTIAQRAGQGDR